MTQIPSPLTIRPAGAEDAVALEDVLMRTYEGTWQPQMTPEKYRHFLDSGKIPQYVAERGALFHVCEVDGRVAGMVDWEKNFIWALHVHPDQQRRGVGAALLALAESGMRAAMPTPGWKPIPSIPRAGRSTASMATPRSTPIPTKSGIAVSPRCCW